MRSQLLFVLLVAIMIVTVSGQNNKCNANTITGCETGFECFNGSCVFPKNPTSLYAKLLKRRKRSDICVWKGVCV